MTSGTPGANGGRKVRPEEVRVHDFVIPELGRAVPYGVYDIADNAGWVSVGIDYDTAAFAVNAIRSWWRLMGREVSIGTQKRPPIGVQKGPLSWRIRNDRAESGRCAGQSRPKPRGGTIAWSSVRSRSQIACGAKCGRSENALRTRQLDRRVRSATSRADASASDCVRAALRTTAGVCEPRASRQAGGEQ